MTVAEFETLQIGDCVKEESYFDGWGWQGVVIEREYCDETVGFQFAENVHTGEMFDVRSIKSGRKYLEITFKTRDGYKKYYDTTRPDKIKRLVKVM